MAGKVDLCKTCGSGGEVISCEKCSSCYHIECVEPPLRHAPRGSWLCTSCKKSNDRKRHHGEFECLIFIQKFFNVLVIRYTDLSKTNGVVVQRTGKMNGQRRCAAQALYKIHDFAKSLRQLSESDGGFFKAPHIGFANPIHALFNTISLILRVSFDYII